MHLDDLAEELRENAITIRDALESLAAYPSLLRTFACDCAERVVWQMTYEGIELGPQETQAIQVARLFCEGERTERDLDEAIKKAVRPWHDRFQQVPYGESGEVLRRSNISWVAFDDALGAAWGAILHSKEPLWQCGRLAWLCEIWSICGDRTPFLLREQNMPIDEPAELSIHA